MRGWLVLATLTMACGGKSPPPTLPQSATALPELEALWVAAQAHHTEALVVLHRGEPVLTWPAESDQAVLPTMSVTKSVVSLGLGTLQDRGLLGEVDQPLATWLPELGDEGRQAITLRHVLEHRSGLEDAPLPQIHASDDTLALASKAPLAHAPGTVFAYNNTATNLLPGLFPAVAEQPVDTWIDNQLFTPMGITLWGWHRDAGGPLGMAGLSLRGSDLARLGQLVLDEGRWQDQALISRDWIANSTTPSAENPKSGWLWWPLWQDQAYYADDALVALWVEAGADPHALEGLSDLEFADRSAFRDALEQRLGPIAVDRLGHAVGPHIHPLARQQVIGVQATGSAGQYLLIYPEWDLVIARQARYRPDEDTTFAEIYPLAEALGPALSSAR